MNRIVILILLLAVACSKDCDSITLPRQVLEDESIDFQTWQGKDTIYYVDSIGTEYLYALEICIEGDEENQFIENVDCRRNVTYETQRFLKRYHSLNGTSIALVQRVDFVMSEEEFTGKNLVDRMAISVFNDTSSTIVDALSRMYLITSERKSDYNKEEMNAQRFALLDSVRILGRKFTDVFMTINDENPIFYTQAEGVVGFTDNQGHAMVLDR